MPYKLISNLIALLITLLFAVGKKKDLPKGEKVKKLDRRVEELIEIGRRRFGDEWAEETRKSMLGYD